MGILIIVCYMLAQFVCAPFWDKRVNVLDCVCAHWITSYSTLHGLPTLECPGRRREPAM